MEIITLLLKNQQVLGITATTAVFLGGTFAFIFYLLNKQQKEIDGFKDMLYGEEGLKPQLEERISIRLLEHYTKCNEKNLQQFASRAELASIKDSIDALSEEIRETRTEMLHSTKAIYNTLIQIAEK